MIDLRTLSLAALILAPISTAQEPQHPTEPPQAARQSPTTKTADQWITDLGADSYRTRLQAEKALREMGQKALPELKKAADSSPDREVQWRARRLVRLIERGSESGLSPRLAPDQDAPVPQPSDSIRQQFEEMFEQMERQFGLDIPRARFFDDDFFHDLKAQLPSAGGRSQGMSMQVGPDGSVKVESKTVNEKGEVETKTYEAKSMQEFEAQYPGVLQQNGLGFGMRWLRSPITGTPPNWVGPRFDRQPWTPMPVQPPEPDDIVVAPPPAGSRLGVSIRPGIPDELREHLGLEAGVGLMVESVQSGTLAESLGLQRGDIVTKIAGQPIGSAQDVQKVLGGVDAGATVEVAFLRKGAEKTASAVKAAAAPDKEPHSERLERRKPKATDPTIR